MGDDVATGDCVIEGIKDKRRPSDKYAYMTVYIPHEMKPIVMDALDFAQEKMHESKSVIVCMALEKGLPQICPGLTGLDGWSKRSTTRRSFGF